MAPKAASFCMQVRGRRPSCRWGGRTERMNAELRRTRRPHSAAGRRRVRKATERAALRSATCRAHASPETTGRSNQLPANGRRPGEGARPSPCRSRGRSDRRRSAPARWRHSINSRTSTDEACDEASGEACGESARRRGRARRTGNLRKKSPKLPRTRPDVGVTAARTKNATEPLLDIPALAERLAVSERFVRRLVHERRVPYLKVGHFVRFDPRDIDELLRTSRVDDRRS